MKMYRVENKFCCTIQEMYQLQQRLSTVLQADNNENSVEGYRVISLYFDDLTDSCLYAAKEGLGSRRKYRIRIYNDSLDRIKLEVKEKQGNRIFKMSKCITTEEMQKLICGHCIPSSSTMEDPAFLFNMAIQTRALCPKTAIAYERKAYVYNPGNVRITFDQNIRTSRQISGWGIRKLSYTPLPGQNAVLEIKYDEFMPKFILQLLELDSLKQTAYSKYCLCREYSLI